MDVFNMDPDLNVRRMTLQHILEIRNLNQPFPVISATGKDDKEGTELFPDATAAFLGPTLWDNSYLDINNYVEYPPAPDYVDVPAQEYVDVPVQEYVDVPVQEYVEPNSESLQTIGQVHSGNEMDTSVCEIENIRSQEIPVLSLPEVPSSVMNSPKMHLNVPDTQECITSHLPSLKSFPPDIENNKRSFSVSCKFSPSDLALATTPGHEHYDPTSTSFLEEELKPQPMIKKSQKNFVPDSLKDEKYWTRRRKNNIAAKRSREARRIKENQIVLRASFLEKENNTLKEDVLRLRAENRILKNKLKKYEH